jgi:23S rRNA 5-hydroxycytidine C2501 synthase
MEGIELLAPARDLETGVAAINCGADAVYLGAARFGAREAAGNSLDTIEQLARYAHKYWARVYVTVNTLLRDEELEQAEQLIHRLYELGADAIIMQDTGLLECSLPPIPLFASTQMHNHTPERVAFLEKVGIRRVILARELSLSQIQAIRAQTTIELESFVHGALCVSYSGQCYLSYALGGRSGNRGQCAQPCRRLYRLVDGKDKILQDYRHLLSLRDLNLSNQLQDLLDAGIRSFKIEGRLKDQAYVMNVVGFYRQKLDAILSGTPYRPASSGTVRLDFSPNPAKTFNRGFTTYFLQGKGAPLTSWDTPKSLGETLGKITAVHRRSFTLDSSIPVQRGDGLCFLDPKRELRGTAVNDVQEGNIFPDKLEGMAVGTQIYRNHDHTFLNALEKSQAARKILVHFILKQFPGGLHLSVQDSDGNQAAFSLEAALTAAEKPETALASVEKQLRKLGGTGYECSKIQVQWIQVPFVPVATLNALRRGALEALDQVREANRPRLTGGKIEPNDIPFPAAVLSFEGNILNHKAEAFYRRHGVTSFESAAESGLNLHGRKVMTTRYCIKHELGACPKQKGARPSALVEPLSLIDEQGNRFPLSFNCSRCQMEVYFQEGPHELTRTPPSTT